MKEEIKSYYRDRQVKEQTKAHFEKHKETYTRIGIGIVSAGLTALVMRRRVTPARVVVRPLSILSRQNVTVVVNRDEEAYGEQL